MVVDGSAPITINVLAEAFAVIDAIRALDAAKGAWYSIYPEGQQALGTVGGTIWLNFRLRNGGGAAGNIYLKVTRNDTGAVIFNQQYSLGINAYVDISNPAPNFVMPNASVSLQIEIGH